jgi:hypothetical protein
MAASLMPIEDAPDEGRRLLGALLAQRRKELGYTHWPAFARARLPLTPSGNPNTRLLADIEKAYRKRFPEPTLRQLARAYEVTYESVTDVAHLRARALTPAFPAAASARVPDESPPMSPAQAAADRPYYDPVNDRRFDLAAEGILDPTGEQMFPADPEAARAWDGPFGRSLPVGDRVWFIAELRRLAAARNAGPNSGTGTTGALNRSNIAGLGVM